MNSHVMTAPASVPVRKSSFVERYGAVFGREQGLMLRMAGLTAAEHSAQG